MPFSALIDLHLTKEIYVFRSMVTKRKKRRNPLRIYNKKYNKILKCRHLELETQEIIILNPERLDPLELHRAPDQELTEQGASRHSSQEFWGL